MFPILDKHKDVSNPGFKLLCNLAPVRHPGILQLLGHQDRPHFAESKLVPGAT